MKPELPKDLPKIAVPEELRAVGRAVIVAGLWADHQLEESLKDPARRAELESRVAGKGGADIVTALDPASETIMTHILETSGYTGGIFGEEGIVRNPTHKLTTVLDGLDGTEAARSMVAGRDSPYGPSAGTFTQENGIIKPLEGAVFLPRQSMGIYGSTESGKVYEFKVEKTAEGYKVAGVKEISPFNQDRGDVKYIVSFFLGADEAFPAWLPKLYLGANRAGDQNILHGSGAQVDFLTKLVREVGPREYNLGPSAAVGARDTRLHDMMGVAPAILTLGGTIGNLDGAKLGEHPEFFPNNRKGGEMLETLKANSRIPEIPIGPVISAHNEKVYERTRAFMLGNDPNKPNT